MTTTTPTLTTPATAATSEAPGQTGQLPAPPRFERQAPGETTAEYGRRAFWYALQLADGASFARLDDAALDAAADEITGAVTQRDISQTTLACLQQLQARLRRSQAARAEWRAERDRQLEALFEAASATAGEARGGTAQAVDAAPFVPQAGSQPGQDGNQGGSGGSGGGGSKVPKAPRPTPRPSPGGLQAMDETGAGAFRPVPALALDANDAF